MYGTSGHFGLLVGSLRHSGTLVTAWPTTLAFFMPSASVAMSLLVMPPYVDGINVLTSRARNLIP